MTLPASLLSVLTSHDGPIELAALLIAEDERPGLAVERWIHELDEIAAPIGDNAIGLSPRMQAELLLERLHQDLGFRGNSTDYYDPRNSYLDDVLRRRLGIPLSLSMVWIAVGQRIGVSVQGIGFPGHFLVRVGGEDGVLVDPYHQKVLGEEGVGDLARRMTGRANVNEADLRPVSARGMTVRMLANLKSAHERRADRARALVACDRLVDLTGSPEFRRDRGLHALSLGAIETALEDLDAYLECRPNASDAGAVRLAHERARTTTLSLQ